MNFGPTTPPTRPARMEDVVRRVYAGRNALGMIGLPLDADKVKIIVGEELWAELLPEHRERCQEAEERGAYYASTVIETDYTCDGSEMRYTMRMFGIRVEADDKLMPHEMRFRSEVTL